MSDRTILICGPNENAVIQELRQTAGQHIARHARSTLEILEASHTHKGVPHDHQGPAVCDDRQSALHGACR